MYLYGLMNNDVSALFCIADVTLVNDRKKLKETFIATVWKNNQIQRLLFLFTIIKVE